MRVWVCVCQHCTWPFCVPGHTSPVVQLSGSRLPALLASLSLDGQLRMWDVAARSCLLVSETDAISMVGGNQHVIGMRGKTLRTTSSKACR